MTLDFISKESSELSLAQLKKTKNRVIGNPLAKTQVAREFSKALVECLNIPTLPEDIRIEAANIVASLTYGSNEALAHLLDVDPLPALLYALSRFPPMRTSSFRTALIRALRAVVTALSNAVGPSLWGIRPVQSYIRAQSQMSLDLVFRIESLDIYLPLLADNSTEINTCIAQLISAAVRTPEQRKAVTDWIPAADRAKEAKHRRGWEKMSTAKAIASAGFGGWVARNLYALSESRDNKLQEAALLALAALTHGNNEVAAVLCKEVPERESHSPLSLILTHTRSRSLDIQLAACLCAIHALRANAVVSHTLNEDEHTVWTIISVLDRIISGSFADHPREIIKACFVLYFLLIDNREACNAVLKRGLMLHVSELIKSVTPLEKADLNKPDPDTDDWEDEPDKVYELREAALLCIASVLFIDNGRRESIIEHLELLPVIHRCLVLSEDPEITTRRRREFRYVGVRLAACQCVRGASRSVAALRTNIIDTGLGRTIFHIFLSDDEDRAVQGAALQTMCNVVLDFSPLKSELMQEGLVGRLLHFLHSDDQDFKLNALWAIKNLSYKMSVEQKAELMSSITWNYFSGLLADPTRAIQEQALNIMKNLTETEDGVQMVFDELGSTTLMRHLMEASKSLDEDVVIQAVYVLANIANGSDEHQDFILSNPDLLAELRTCLGEKSVDIRRPAVACVLHLARSNYSDPARRRRMIDAGLLATLKHVCERSATGPLSVIIGGVGGGFTRNTVKDVLEQAREAVDCLEHGI
ncbi:ARM repeat-containing protein [Fistulina hepatica ATCC 64428]|uniref:ARM repeat-containing protein n=1 Tax=Fistulina hepatica ATCC 64428 TaxID=1128425 RepID=A0A0D7A7Q2_9AGAR|nr:ARM repeat-containing protein [Fistulina hepatica ATCC 64428]